MPICLEPHGANRSADFELIPISLAVRSSAADEDVRTFLVGPGTYRLAPQQPERHEVAVKVVNRAHAPIGVGSSVAVDIQ